MPIGLKLRFSLLVIAAAGVSAACVAEAVISIQSGICALPFGRGGTALEFTRMEQPLGFFLTVFCFAFLALGMAFAAAFGLRCLFSPGQPKCATHIASSVAAVERAAPSGLRPLAVGLMVAAGCVALYLASRTQ